METELLVPLLMRWIHIGTAIVLVGGLVFYRFVFVPVANRILSDEERERLREPLMRRWKLFIHPPIILFLVSGFYNYAAVTSGQHDGQALYHALFGMKFLCAIGVFALGIMLTSTMKWSEQIRAKQALWSVLLLLSAAVVLIAGFMHTMPGVDVIDDSVPAEALAIPEASGE